VLQANNTSGDYKPVCDVRRQKVEFAMLAKCADLEKIERKCPASLNIRAKSLTGQVMRFAITVKFASLSLRISSAILLLPVLSFRLRICV
jgi:hypothetical protein